MTKDKELQQMGSFSNSLLKDPVRLKVFLRQVMGRPHRTLKGKEKNDIILLLALIEPFNTTNNQHSWTEYYRIGETEYHVTNFSDDEVIIEEMLKEEDEPTH